MWENKKVLVTGGASFIGSHLVDTLLKAGSTVTVADDFSSGKLTNLEYPLKKRGPNSWFFENLNICRGDLKEKSFTKSMMENTDVVFHLAALHGGRGYIAAHPAQCCTNLERLLLER